jgi:hypothetical protein
MLEHQVGRPLEVSVNAGAASSSSHDFETCSNEYFFGGTKNDSSMRQLECSCSIYWASQCLGTCCGSYPANHWSLHSSWSISGMLSGDGLSSEIIERCFFGSSCLLVGCQPPFTGFELCYSIVGWFLYLLPRMRKVGSYHLKVSLSLQSIECYLLSDPQSGQAFIDFADFWLLSAILHFAPWVPSYCPWKGRGSLAFFSLAPCINLAFFQNLCALIPFSNAILSPIMILIAD